MVLILRDNDTTTLENNKPVSLMLANINGKLHIVQNNTVQDSNLFKGNFKMVINPNLELPFLNNESSIGEYYKVKNYHFLDGSGLLTETYKENGGNQRAIFYKLSNNKEIVVKYVLPGYPIIGKIGRCYEDSRIRNLGLVIQEIERKGIFMETLLGYIELENYFPILIVEKKKGITASEFFPTKIDTNKKEVVISIGIELAKIHSLGVVHIHPHNLNWIINGNNASLVDIKGVQFKEEFPHTYKNSKKVLTWEDVINNDIIVVLNFLPKKYHDLFKKTYNDYLNPTKK
ncbi:MAG: hypothetical protein WC850_01425 [Candidatus Gracilibacteria bacterium]